MQIILIVGAVIGAAVGWLICVLLGPKGHFEQPNYWVWDRPARIGGFGQFAIILICGFIGAIAALFFGNA